MVFTKTEGNSTSPLQYALEEGKLNRFFHAVRRLGIKKFAVLKIYETVTSLAAAHTNPFQFDQNTFESSSTGNVFRKGAAKTFVNPLPTYPKPKPMGASKFFPDDF